MTDKPQERVGVVVCRVQVDDLHTGHLALIRAIQEAHPYVCVLLGVHPAPADERDPLDFRLREAMIRYHVPVATILPVCNHEDDAAWSQAVDATVRLAFPTDGYVLYGGRDSCLDHYHGSAKKRTLDLGFDAESGTAIRERIRCNPEHTRHFRAGVIYAHQTTYARVSPTVDLAVLKGQDVCLIRKPGLAKWGFPGGFVSPADASYEQAARRELMEETGLTLEVDPTYVGSFRVDDWRTRGRKSVITTTLFTAPYFSGKPRAQDDVEAAEWFALPTLPRHLVANAHLPLLDRLLRHLGYVQ